jgi:nicotinate-nucleotide adenylyltransferase
MRLGIYGGSFDPVHYGHLLLAELCREQLRLDQVWFIPAAVSPHKQDAPATDADHRSEMLRLAIGGNPAMQVSEIELLRGGVSYTYQTLQDIQDEDPSRELFFLMGADSLTDLPSWRKPDEICRLATLVVVERADSPPIDFDCLRDVADEPRREEFARHRVKMPRIELSSSEIRRRVADGKSIRYQTPAAVEKYIEAEKLYGSDGV